MRHIAHLRLPLARPSLGRCSSPLSRACCWIRPGFLYRWFFVFLFVYRCQGPEKHPYPPPRPGSGGRFAFGCSRVGQPPRPPRRRTAAAEAVLLERNQRNIGIRTLAGDEDMRDREMTTTTAPATPEAGPEGSVKTLSRKDPRAVEVVMFPAPKGRTN